MNILLITPGINKKFNDNYFIYDYIAKLGNNILVVTQRENINKAGKEEISPELEIDGSLVIHRIFKNLNQQNSLIYLFINYNKIKNLIFDFKPDIILCEELSNMVLATLIKRSFFIPIVLRVEFAFDKEHPYRTMGNKLKFFKNSLTGDYFPILIGSAVWNWACRSSDSIISCYFEDASKKDSIKNKSFDYVPWPTFHSKSTSKVIRSKNSAVFIGSFDRHKCLKEFSTSIPLLFKYTQIREFYIVGSGEDMYIIEDLILKWPKKIKYIPYLSRDECLDLIRSCYISYSPAIRGGWGFIGDSWAMKTPVVVTNNHYCFKHGVDSIVTTPDKLISSINELYSDNKLYEKISSGGYERFIDNHTVEVVGQKFSDICTITILNFKNNF